MKFFSFIGKIFKKIANGVIGFFKGKNPVDAINDTTKTIIGAATAGVSIYAAVNIVRTHLIPSKKANTEAPRAAQSGADYMMSKREAGSIENKIANMRANTSNIRRRSTSATTSLKQEELNMLANIAETRNAYFKELSPEEQMNLLIMEGFDFEAFKAENRSTSHSPLALIREESKAAQNKPFREEKDYGFFNFIMRPLSDFYHWAINDPIPKKVPQIHLIDVSEIPNISCSTAQDAVDAARALNSYLEANRKADVMYNGKSQAAIIAQQIQIEEVFRHDTLSGYNHAVNRRLKASMANPSLYALLGDEREGRRLDEERERRLRRERERDLREEEDDREMRRRRASSIFDGEDDGDPDDDDEFEARERRRKNPDEAEADRRAQEMIDYHMRQSRRGVIDRSGFDFKI